jgi:hypothetical protein
VLPVVFVAPSVLSPSSSVSHYKIFCDFPFLLGQKLSGTQAATSEAMVAAKRRSVNGFFTVHIILFIICQAFFY